MEIQTKPIMAEFNYRSHGPMMEHNYYCSVCREVVAVIDLNTGILQPCWGCQEKGFCTIKMSWFQKLIKRIKGE